MIRLIVLLSIVCTAFPCMAYTPPTGIPDPSAYFSTFGEIDQASPSVVTTGNPKCTNWPSSATEGCYYVDKTHPSATNTDNIYGYPDKPRYTPPEGSLAAGSLVYIHAGTYTEANSAGQNMDWSGNGTAESPIWITGNPTTRPIIQDQIGIGWGARASYMVIENLEISGITNANISLRPLTDGVNIDHILIRNILRTGTDNDADYGFVGLGISSSEDESPNGTISYIVVYNSVASHIGNLVPSATDDSCAIYHGGHVDSIWILNNTIHTIVEDGIAGCHYCNATKTATNLFIGGNTLYNFGANAIDLKSVQGFIISSNTIYGPNIKETEGGGIIVVHNAAITGSTASSNGWILFNSIYNNSGGINLVTANNPNSNMNVIGNVFYDIDTDYSGGGAGDYVGSGVMVAVCRDGCNIVDNTIYSVEQPIKIMDSLSGEGDSVDIYGNIISNINEDGYDINITTNGAEAKVDLDYNLFYHPIGGAAAKIFWANASHSMDEIKGHSECANCLEVDPLLTNPSTDFTLQSSSPAIGANTEHAVYDLFTTTWAALGFEGLSIKKDISGTTRPQQTTWDMGAYEYNPSTALKQSLGGGSIGGGAMR